MWSCSMGQAGGFLIVGICILRGKSILKKKKQKKKKQNPLKHMTQHGYVWFTWNAGELSSMDMTYQQREG